MAMSKKDIVALADALRNINVGKHENPTVHAREEAIISALCLFMFQTNPRFNEQRWRDYLAGNCGPNGGKDRYNGNNVCTKPGHTHQAWACKER